MIPIRTVVDETRKMIEFTKLCKVHGKLNADEIIVTKQKDKNGDFRTLCKKCRYISVHKWSKKNKSKMNQYKKEYLKRNILKRRELRRKSAKNIAKSLTDGYVRRLLTRKGLPQELIETKRLSIKLKRKLKEVKICKKLKN